MSTLCLWHHCALETCNKIFGLFVLQQITDRLISFVNCDSRFTEIDESIDWKTFKLLDYFIYNIYGIFKSDLSLM